MDKIRIETVAVRLGETSVEKDSPNRICTTLPYEMTPRQVVDLLTEVHRFTKRKADEIAGLTKPML